MAYLDRKLGDYLKAAGPIERIKETLTKMKADKDLVEDLGKIVRAAEPQSDGSASYRWGPLEEPARRINNAFSVLSREGRDLPASMQETLEGVTDSTKAIQSLRTSISSSVVAEDKGEVKSPWTNQRLISELATRLGSVMILLFLVQILVTMYRYNTRVASYFDARADALSLWADTFKLDPDLKIEEWAKLVAQISPDNMDFGKLPKTPANEITESIKDLSNTAKDLLSSVVKGK